MSVCSWVLIFLCSWTLARARTDLARGLPVFWAAPDVGQGRDQLKVLDRGALMLPLIEAAMQDSAPGTLAASAQKTSQLTRRLRDALHVVLNGLNRGQVVLATIGATA